jgi:NAD-dependent SIR2 family protein deacetylase
VLDAQPNAGHIGLAELEKHFDVQIITQNIDDLMKEQVQLKCFTTRRDF